MHLFESEPMQIGKHEWRLIVYQHPCYGPLTEYQYRLTVNGQSFPGDPWSPETRWPRYNSNDGTYAGLPHSLKRLYAANESTVKALLVSARATLLHADTARLSEPHLAEPAQFSLMPEITAPTLALDL